MRIVPVACLKDNYAYLVHEPQSNAVAIVDPSEAKPVLEALAAHKLKLTHIFNTHHHWDHTGGNLELKKTGAKITGPKHDADRIPGIDIGVAEGDIVELGKARAQILDIPAHTKHHIAFWFGDANAVFTEAAPLKAELKALPLGTTVGIRDIAAVAGGLLLLPGPVNDQPITPSVVFYDPKTGTLGTSHTLKVADITAKAETLLVLSDAAGQPWRVLVMFDGPENGAPAEYRVPR